VYHPVNRGVDLFRMFLEHIGNVLVCLGRSVQNRNYAQNSSSQVDLGQQDAVEEFEHIVCLSGSGFS